MVHSNQNRKGVISEKQGRPIYKHIAILDLAGLGRKHVSSDFYQPMKKMIDIGSRFVAYLHHDTNKI